MRSSTGLSGGESIYDHQRIFNNSVGTSAAELARGIGAAEMVGIWLVIALFEASSTYRIHHRRQIRVLGCVARFFGVCNTLKNHFILVSIL